MTITLLDRILFAMERAYNRSIGKYVFNWDHNGVTIFGFSFVLKSTVDLLHSKGGNKILQAGLTTLEIQEMYKLLDSIGALPRPGFPDGTYTDRQKREHGITLIANSLYMYRT